MPTSHDQSGRPIEGGFCGLNERYEFDNRTNANGSYNCDCPQEGKPKQKRTNGNCDCDLRISEDSSEMIFIS